MRPILGAVLIGLVAISTGGCKETFSDRLVGTWSGQPDENGKAFPITYKFREKGKLGVEMFGMGLEGTWKVVSEEGDQAVIHVIVDFPGDREDTDTKYTIRLLSDDRFAMVHPDDGRLLSQFARE